MAIDVTIGGPDANSYVTVEEADSYFEDRLHSDAWVDTFEEKGQALITATKTAERYIDWNYTRKNTSQSLTWPCVSAVDKFGTSIPSTIIPVAVKEAIFELALSIVDEDRTLESDLAGIASIKIGPLSITSDRYDRKDAISPLVWQIVGHLGRPFTGKSSAFVELGRG